MTVEIWLAVIAVVGTPSGAALAAIFLRGKYRAEIAALRADVDKRIAEVRGNELDNVREGNDILMSQIVDPLKLEIKQLRSDVNKLRRAVEKIPSCPHADLCPVSDELRSAEADAADADAHGAELRDVAGATDERHRRSAGRRGNGARRDGDHRARRADGHSGRGVRHDRSEGSAPAPDVENSYDVDGAGT